MSGDGSLGSGYFKVHRRFGFGLGGSWQGFLCGSDVWNCKGFFCCKVAFQGGCLDVNMHIYIIQSYLYEYTAIYNL